MEADWEVEIGGGAPVIDALWPGFVDLRSNPDSLGEIVEAAGFRALGGLLEVLNGERSPLWTSKCDLWEPDAADLASLDAAAGARSTLACYVDLLPLVVQVFAHWQQAELLCREWVARLEPVPMPHCRVELVVRQAIAGAAEGFAITAYLSAWGQDRAGAAEALAAAMAAFSTAIPAGASAATPA